jgi:hypothetical protein
MTMLQASAKSVLDGSEGQISDIFVAIKMSDDPASKEQL